MPVTRHIAISMLDHAIRKSVPPEHLSLRDFTTNKVTDEEERFIRAMVLLTLRHLGQIDALIALSLEKPLPKGKHWVKCAIRIGLAQSALMRVPAHASVHATVQAIKKSKFRGLAGLANYVLREHARAEPALPHAVHNVPPWLHTRWSKHYGAEEVQRIAVNAERHPPLDLYWRNDETPLPPHGKALLANHCRLPNDTEVTAIEGYAEGAFFVQDLAASYPVRMLGDVKEKTVLEVGASPGGKTAQLCALGAEVTALDRSRTRAEILFTNLERLQMHPGVVVSDVFEFTASDLYDIIVIDAPCSATGTWRRHPEVVHLLEESSISELAQQQRAMMMHVWKWLKPGGKMLYCVCSLEREEGEDHIAPFLEAHPDARVAPAANPENFAQGALHPEGYLRTHPALLAEEGGMDGFFAVIFEKHA